MKMMTSPGDCENKSGASFLHCRNELAENMRSFFEEEQLCTSITACMKSSSSDLSQWEEVADKQQQQKTRKRSIDEICDQSNHGKFSLCNHHDSCDCGRIDASLFSDVSSQELDKWLGNLVTATGDGHRESNRSSGNEKIEESFSPSLAVGHRQRCGYGFSRKESKSDTNFPSSQSMSIDVCGGINAQVIHHDYLNDSLETLPIIFNETNTTELSSHLFQQQQVKRSKTEISSQKHAGVIRQDRTQQNGQLYTSAHVKIS